MNKLNFSNVLSNVLPYFQVSREGDPPHSVKLQKACPPSQLPSRDAPSHHVSAGQHASAPNTTPRQCQPEVASP